MKMLRKVSLLAALGLVAGGARPIESRAAVLDTVVFGDARSESTHALAADRSDVVAGGLSTPARRLLPSDPPQNDGGKISFTLKVDPAAQNYVTVKLWGSEKGSELGRLYLFIDGKQVGYRHIGDVEPIDIASDGPGYAGRFYYSTTPLPLALTKDKTVANLEIRSGGRIWGYGMTYDRYQHVLKQPTRGIYAAYCHTDGYFEPPASEKQGEAVSFASLPVRTTPGVEFLEKAKARVNNTVTAQLNAKELWPDSMAFLARTYNMAWTSAHDNPVVITKIVGALDDLSRKFSADKTLPTKGWEGYGAAGEAIWLVFPQLQPLLDQPVDADGDASTPPIPRRAAWSAMLVASRDFWRTHRRFYTNQAMIVDMNVYLANKGVRLIDPQNALPEAQVLEYLHQAVGLKPWLGSDTPTGPDKSMGGDFYLITAKGLTRELGYVGRYGEILPIMTDMVRVTEGDPQLKAQLMKVLRARANFRYPAPDDEGFRSMRLEQVVGWRDSQYPGEITYGDRIFWGTAFMQASQLKDPIPVGFAQQAITDNQVWSNMEGLLGRRNDLNADKGLLNAIEGYEIVKALPPSPIRLPMSAGRPDFVFADEQAGVLALKNGEEKLYVSLYWRARYGINNLARVHFITPRLDRLATVYQETQFTPSGLFYTRGNRTNLAYSDKMPVPGINSANAGETMPIAKIPADINFKPGDENIYAGKAEFYRLRYGPYLIGMNTTKDKTFDLGVSGNASARELVSGKTLKLSTPIKVAPQSTVVIYLKDAQGEIQMKPWLRFAP